MGVAAWGCIQVFAPVGIVDTFFRLFISVQAALWMILDARKRGIHVPHILQPFIMFAWYLVVPCYLIATGKWWGVLWSIVHAFALLTVTEVAMTGSVICWNLLR